MAQRLRMASPGRLVLFLLEGQAAGHRPLQLEGVPFVLRRFHPAQGRGGAAQAGVPPPGGCPGVLLLGEVVMEPAKVVPYFGTQERPECHMLYNVPSSFHM